jgi:MraZ protein
MFIGIYEHTIDDKSRLTLPARFRDALGDAVVLARGLDGNVAVYPKETWSVTVEARISALDPLSREARELRRFFFSGAAESSIDRQGRILVPAVLTRHAGLERDVVVAGNYDHLELWQPAAWEQHLHAVEGSAEHAAERLAARGS